MCTRVSDPDKFQTGSDDGSGRCDFCSNIIENWYSCNNRALLCDECYDNYYVGWNGTCILINGMSSNSTNKTGGLKSMRTFNHQTGIKKHQ